MSFNQYQKNSDYLEGIINNSTLCDVSTRAEVENLISSNNISRSKLSSVLQSEIGHIDISKKSNSSLWLLRTVTNVINSKGDRMKKRKSISVLTLFLKLDELGFSCERSVCALELFCNYIWENAEFEGNDLELRDICKKLSNDVMDFCLKNDKKTHREFMEIFSQSRTCRKDLGIISIPWGDLKAETIKAEKEWDEIVERIHNAEPEELNASPFQC